MAGCVVLVALTLAVAAGWTRDVDHATLGWFTPLDHPRPVHLAWRILVMAGQFWLVGTAVLVLGAARSWQSRSWRPFLVRLAAVAGLDLLLLVSKQLTGRTSPHSGLNEVLGAGTSYPSGHTANATVCLVLLALLSRRRAAVPVAVAVAFGVGLANLVLGYHWISDVLGGWLLGTVIVTAAMTRIRRAGSRRPQSKVRCS
jgi:undecaprenyl-diphosphatase